MGVTTNFVQLKRKKLKSGEIPIYIRFTQNRKSTYKSTGIAVKEKYWNARNQIISKSHPQAKKLNRELERQEIELLDGKFELKQEGKLNPGNLKEVITEENPDSLVKKMDDYEKKLERDRYHEWKKFKVVNKQLKEFLELKKNKYSINISIQEVDAVFLEDFQYYLMNGIGEKTKATGERNNNPNTVRRKFRSFKGLFSELLKKKEIGVDPFILMDKVKENQVEKSRLTIDQIEALQNVELDKGSSLWHTRNYFFYSFYNAGIRFGDLCLLKWSDIIDDRLQYKMRKTGARKSIKQLAPMRGILDHYRSEDATEKDYIFPILKKKCRSDSDLLKHISSRNVIVNKQLKKLAKKAEIETNLTFHISRHSFTQYALKNGMDIYSISKALGHKSLKTTEQYIDSFDEDLLDKDMNNLFNQ